MKTISPFTMNPPQTSTAACTDGNCNPGTRNLNETHLLGGSLGGVAVLNYKNAGGKTDPLPRKNQPKHQEEF